MTEQESLIHELAELAGIEKNFFDIWGARHETSLSTTLKILEAMNINTDSEEILRRELHSLRTREWTRMCPPVWVVFEDEPKPLPVHVPLSAGQTSDRIKTAHFSLTDEAGVTREWSFEGGDLTVAESHVIRGVTYRRFLLDLPRGLDIGYHNFSMSVVTESDVHRHVLQLIVCPALAYQPPCLQGEGRAAGSAVALYGLRSDRNWGVGDFTDLKTLASWTADDLHGDVIGLNPLLAIPNRFPYHHSPYLPVTRFFYNFLYLDVEAAAGFHDSPDLREELNKREIREWINRLRTSETVDYEGAARLKEQMLWPAFRSFMARPATDREREEFDSYAQKQGKLLNLYGIFMALTDHFASREPPLWGWRQWPRDYHDPDSEAVARFAHDHADRVEFHQYLQWEIERQLGSVEEWLKEKGLKIGLYQDMPLAVDGAGFDTWLHQDLFAVGMSAGAPPDPFSPRGQDWGFPPLIPDVCRQDAYRYFIEILRRSMRGGALRIDHAMQFFRLFWIPEKEKPAQGAYVLYPAEDLVGILALESVRSRTLIIGEDLGTVPVEIRELFQKRGVYSYRVLYFEKDREDEFKRPDSYPVQALVTVSTHDLPTFEGWWKGKDIEIRYKLGVFETEERHRGEWAEREADKRKLLHALKEQNLLPDWHPADLAQLPEVTPELHAAIVGYAAKTKSKLLLLNQEDIFRDVRQQNLPGTTSEVPNWVTKMRFTLEDLKNYHMAVGCAAMVRGWIDFTGRNCGRKTD